MECRWLKEVCDLIRTYSDYKSYTAIAGRLGLGEGTLRGYWENYSGHVPDRNADRFAALVQEVVPVPLTREAALDLLCGSPLAFHNMLLPIGGRSWRTLLDEQVELQIRVPPAYALGFGEVEGEDMPVADATVALGDRFRFRGHMKWCGEGFLAAEHGGEWHLIALGPNQRSFAFGDGEFDVPLSKDGKPRYLRELETPGFYLYVVIGQKGTLPGSVRHQIQRTNPYSQLDLDLLASLILESDPSDRIVLAATLRVATHEG